MGQKTIPQSLRLHHLKNWNSEWMTTSSDYAKLFYLEFTIHQYLKYFCKRNHLYLHRILLRKVDQELIIGLHFLNVRNQATPVLASLEHYLSHYINSYLQTLRLEQPLVAQVFLIQVTLANLKLEKQFLKKKPTLSLRRLSRFQNLVKITYIAFYLQNPDLINRYLTTKLQKNKRHKQFLKNIKQLWDKQLVHFPNCLGYRLELLGRVNGRARAKPALFMGGRTPANQIDCVVKYQTQEILTLSGICNLKTFFYYKK